MKADATPIEGDREWPLFTNPWADGAVAPAGQVHIKASHLDGRVPVSHYAVGDVRLEHRIWLEQGADRVHLAWRLLTPSPDRGLRLRVALLANARDHHQVARGPDPAPD